MSASFSLVVLATFPKDRHTITDATYTPEHWVSSLRRGRSSFVWYIAFSRDLEARECGPGNVVVFGEASDSTTDIPQPLKCPGTIAPPPFFALISSAYSFRQHQHAFSTDLRTAWRLHDSFHAHDLLDVLNALLLVTSGLAIDHALYDMDPHDTTNNPPAGPVPSEHSSTTPHATRRQRIRRSITRHIHALRSTLFRRSRASHDFTLTNDNPTHATAHPGRTDDILDAIERHRETTEQGFNRIADAISQAALGLAGQGGGPGGFPPGIAPGPPEVDDHQSNASFTTQEASSPNDDMLNLTNPDLTGQPSRPLVRLPRPVSPSQNEIRPSNDPRSPRASREYDTSEDDETMQAAESGRRSQGERVSRELAESGAGPSHAPLGNLAQAHEVVGDGQRDDAREATSREQQAIAAPQEDNAPQASSSQEHYGIGDSINATGATSAEGDSAFVLSTHDRDTLNDILAHPEAYQINVEFQLAADSPKDDLYPQLAPSPASVHPALYAPLSRTIPLPALEEQSPADLRHGVAPAQSGPVASSSGNTNAAQTSGVPLAFPSLETSSTHSESSALLHYSPAAEAETRRYDERSARRELAAVMSDPPRGVVDQEVETEQQQQQSVASAPASHKEAAHPSSPPQDRAPPDDEAEQSSDGASQDFVRDVDEEDRDSTYIYSHDCVVTNGVFSTRKLLIYVGTKSQLPDPSEPFAEGLSRLLDVCNARRHDLTQLYTELHQVKVVGGQSATRDALDTILLRLGQHLRGFLTFAVVFKAADDSAGEDDHQARQRIAQSFSRLTHVRVAGKTTASRLNTFSLEKLRVLEVLTSISEADVCYLLQVCARGKMATLVAGPIDMVNPACLVEQSVVQAPPNTVTRSVTPAYPAVLHVSSPFPCKQLLAMIPPGVELHFTLTDSYWLRDVERVFETRGEEWTLRLS
ncbi:hypothetical protein EV121DRAFT_213432 [Schizophyllum commune]